MPPNIGKVRAQTGGRMLHYLCTKSGKISVKMGVGLYYFMGIYYVFYGIFVIFVCFCLLIISFTLMVSSSRRYCCIAHVITTNR